VAGSKGSRPPSSRSRPTLVINPFSERYVYDNDREIAKLGDESARVAFSITI